MCIILYHTGFLIYWIFFVSTDKKAIRSLEHSLEEFFSTNGYRSGGVVSIHVQTDNIKSTETLCWDFNKGFSRFRCGHKRFRLPESSSELFLALTFIHLNRTKTISFQDKPFAKGGLLQLLQPVPDDLLSEVTIEHLLRHTSGIVDPKEHVPCDSHVDLKHLLKHPFAAPGFKYRRCRACYGILCKIIHRLTGVRCEKFIKKVVLAHLGFNRFAYRRRRRKSGSDSQCGWVGRPRDFVSVFRLVCESGEIELARPELPFFQHKGSWPGYGVRVSSDGFVWSDSYRDRNDSLALHSVEGKTNVTIFLNFRENRHKILKPIVNSVIKKWSKAEENEEI